MKSKKKKTKLFKKIKTNKTAKRYKAQPFDFKNLTYFFEIFNFNSNMSSRFQSGEKGSTIILTFKLFPISGGRKVLGSNSTA